MRSAEIGKVYNCTSLDFWSLFMFLIYCHSQWNQQSKKQHNMHCSFHNIKRRVQRSINMAKATPYKSNITYITIHFLWTAMNLLWLFKRISVAWGSGENISNSWQACKRSPAQTCNFWAPSSSNTHSNWHIDSITSSALFLKQTLHYHTSELRTELTNNYTLKQQKKVHNRVEISSFGETIYFPYKQSNKGFRATRKGTLSFSFSAERKKEACESNSYEQNF